MRHAPTQTRLVKALTGGYETRLRAGRQWRAASVQESKRGVGEGGQGRATGDGRVEKVSSDTRPCSVGSLPLHVYSKSWWLWSILNLFDVIEIESVLTRLYGCLLAYWLCPVAGATLPLAPLASRVCCAALRCPLPAAFPSGPMSPSSRTTHLWAYCSEGLTPRSSRPPTLLLLPP